MMWRWLTLILCIGSACAFAQTDSPASAPANTSASAPAEKHWYFITLNAAPVGWSCMQIKPMSGGFRTDSETRLRMAREKQIMSMITTSWVEEDASGRALRGGQNQSGAGTAVRVTWEWAADGIHERRIQGAGVSERLLPPIGDDTMPPAAAFRASCAAQTPGNLNYSLMILDPSQGPAPTEVRWQRIGPDTVEVSGKSIQCTKWKSTGPLIPLGSEEWINAAGELLQSQTPTGLGVLRSVMCDQATALSALSEAKPPVEIMVSSFVKVDRPLVDVMKLRSVKLVVKAKQPPIKPPPQEGFQRVTRNSDGSFEVTVDLDRPAEPVIDSALKNPDYMESSPMIDWQDQSIMALKDSAFATAPLTAAPATETSAAATSAPIQSANERALLLRCAVAKHLTNKNLSSAFASASECCKSKSGDCTEHAVLLAALLRANGIPSRVAAGLVWADYFAGEKNVFAWHMWTQALIDGRWMDLDATLAADGAPFHAGHLLLAVTPLRDAASDPAWSSLLSSMGNLSIQVLDGTHP